MRDCGSILKNVINSQDVSRQGIVHQLKETLDLWA
jgi:hypothetical protein